MKYSIICHFEKDNSEDELFLKEFERILKPHMNRILTNDSPIVDFNEEKQKAVKELVDGTIISLSRLKIIPNICNNLQMILDTEIMMIEDEIKKIEENAAKNRTKGQVDVIDKPLVDGMKSHIENMRTQIKDLIYFGKLANKMTLQLK